MRRVLITGTAGFIGYHLAELLLAEGWLVHGVDAFTDYYDVTLKHARQARLQRSNAFSATLARLEDLDALSRAAEDFRPEVIVHLAAQAGVRYSLENPRSYVDTNVTGTFNVIEVARQLGVKHVVFASTSSVYGGNSKMPFEETDKADQPLTIYAATKKAGEALAHSYAHLWGVPMTGLRFFTVYGPWGRPDMALFKFTRAILDGEPIDIYNGGEMYRDFTYIDDLVRAIALLIDAVPVNGEPVGAHDSLSGVAPFRVVNIGNNDKVKLLDFIDALEQALGIPAHRNYMEMQKGDVAATWADSRLLKSLTGFSPATDYRTGVRRFVEWYRGHYQR
ncbi:UDP-glucuronate 5-epimerase [Aestuariivirga litoralis]|uniref:UDP-glucuronate 5-epimerase n=1 Tax=Aestuariivirga litoralis TaxID=2650924 RepID=A0A2W2BQ67_9HYPH|nr:SDR family NAD(P)-dependent oxidoreductase [Aestuariivirga litoralis]PZF75536.1 UDP-glucuronate 5-epimerase [Aestuariivirga litoralis]